MSEQPTPYEPPSVEEIDTEGMPVHAFPGNSVPAGAG
jgi:hypothetical protein